MVDTLVVVTFISIGTKSVVTVALYSRPEDVCEVNKELLVLLEVTVNTCEDLSDAVEVDNVLEMVVENVGAAVTVFVTVVANIIPVLDDWPVAVDEDLNCGGVDVTNAEVVDNVLEVIVENVGDAVAASVTVDVGSIPVVED